MEILNKFRYAIALINMHCNYISSFGLRLWLIIFLKTKDEVQLTHPNLKYPFHIRTNTSDVREFFEVIMEEEYKIEDILNPLTIVDLGGNNGDTASFFASKYPKSKIVTIEPEKSNYIQLQKNTCNYSNIKTINSAVWFEKTMLKIENEYDAKWAFRVKSEKSKKNKDGQLESVTVEEIMEINKFDRIDILKIDIEGAEKELFSKNYEKWLPLTKCILIELHDRFKNGCKYNFENALSGHNFAIRYISDNQAIAVNRNLL